MVHCTYYTYQVRCRAVSSELSAAVLYLLHLPGAVSSEHAALLLTILCGDSTLATQANGPIISVCMRLFLPEGGTSEQDKSLSKNSDRGTRWHLVQGRSWAERLVVA